ncbi:MAG: small multi-drug export protein [Oscillospiraceae bacterium]|nr:small multi-drug export protein [Oscillospiraceae bacterium]
MSFIVEHLGRYPLLVTFLTALLPVIELRGALPLGVSLGLPHLEACLAAVVGNLVPVPFIIIFVRRVFAWLKKHIPAIGGFVTKMEQRAESKREYIAKWQLLGLFLLVAIPLPGTGAWTGALVAALLDIRLKRAFPTITLGVLAAGLIVLAITYGVSHIVG